MNIDKSLEMLAPMAVAEGVKDLAALLAPTYGPRGHRQRLDDLWSSLGIARETHDTPSLAQSYRSMGRRLARRFAVQTLDKTGNGAATTILMANEILSAALNSGQSNNSVEMLLDQVAEGLRYAIDVLDRFAEPVRDRTQVLDLIRTATNDREIAEVATEAIDRTGKDAFITVQEPQTVPNYKVMLDHQEGFIVPCGYASRYFLTEEISEEIYLQNPHILVSTRQIDDALAMVGFLEKVVQSKRPLLIAAPAFGANVLELLVLNKQKNVLESVAVSVAGLGQDGAKLLADLAVISGTTPTNHLPKANDLTTLGRSEAAVVSKDRTSIIQGAGNKEVVLAHIKDLSARAEDFEERHESGSALEVRQRAARLAGGIAIINCYGRTLDDAWSVSIACQRGLISSKSGIAGGVLPGGFGAFRIAAKHLEDSQTLGHRIAARGLRSPLEALVNNSSVKGSEWLRLFQFDDVLATVDLSTGDIVSAEELQILDSRDSLESTITGAYYIAQLVLTNEAILSALKGGAGV